jgi:hypothetical protein
MAREVISCSKSARELVYEPVAYFTSTRTAFIHVQASSSVSVDLKPKAIVIDPKDPSQAKHRLTLVSDFHFQIAETTMTEAFHLPLDIEREIFEITARLYPHTIPQLLRVARRILAW